MECPRKLRREGAGLLRFSQYAVCRTIMSSKKSSACWCSLPVEAQRFPSAPRKPDWRFERVDFPKACFANARCGVRGQIHAIIPANRGQPESRVPPFWPLAATLGARRAESDFVPGDRADFSASMIFHDQLGGRSDVRSESRYARS